MSEEPTTMLICEECRDKLDHQLIAGNYCNYCEQGYCEHLYQPVEISDDYMCLECYTSYCDATHDYYKDKQLVRDKNER